MSSKKVIEHKIGNDDIELSQIGDSQLYNLRINWGYYQCRLPLIEAMEYAKKQLVRMTGSRMDKEIKKLKRKMK